MADVNTQTFYYYQGTHKVALKEFQMPDGLWDEIKGSWKQIKGEAKQQWGMLTDDDLDYAEGEREKLVGRIQQRYGRARQDVEREVDEWLERRRRSA